MNSNAENPIHKKYSVAGYLLDQLSFAYDTTPFWESAQNFVNRITVGNQWHPYYTTRIRSSKDGTDLTGCIMRRRIETQIEYRAMTETEEIEISWYQANR